MNMKSIVIILFSLISLNVMGQSVTGQEGEDCTSKVTLQAIENMKAIYPSVMWGKISDFNHNENAIIHELTDLSKSTFEDLCKQPSNRYELKKRFSNAKYNILYTNINGNLYAYYENINKRATGIEEDPAGRGKHISFGIDLWKKEVLPKFAEPHWNNTDNNSIEKRLDDLSHLAEYLSVGLFGIKDHIRVKWLQADEIEIQETVARMYPQGTSDKDIGFNKEAIKKAKPEEAINALAHELFHKYQEIKVEEFRNVDKDNPTLDRLSRDRIRLALEKENPNIRAWMNETSAPLSSERLHSSLQAQGSRYGNLNDELKKTSQKVRTLKERGDTSSPAYNTAVRERDSVYNAYRSLKIESDAISKGSEIEVVSIITLLEINKAKTK